MVTPSSPFTQTVLHTRCPRHRVMNYGSSLSALFCSVTALGGKSMRFGTCGYACPSLPKDGEPFICTCYGKVGIIWLWCFLSAEEIYHNTTGYILQALVQQDFWGNESGADIIRTKTQSATKNVPCIYEKRLWKQIQMTVYTWMCTEMLDREYVTGLMLYFGAMQISLIFDNVLYFFPPQSFQIIITLERTCLTLFNSQTCDTYNYTMTHHLFSHNLQSKTNHLLFHARQKTKWKQAATRHTVQLRDLECDQRFPWRHRGSHKALVTITADSLPKSTQPL